MKSFSLDIRTPEKRLFSGTVEKLIVSAIDGELGVLAGHQPLSTILDKGTVRYTLAGDIEKNLSIYGGFLIINNDHATILTTSL